MKQMKTTAALFAVCVLLTACLKDTLNKSTGSNTGSTTSGGGNSTNGNSGATNTGSITVPTSTLSGMWVLVNDSLNTAFWGIWDGRAPIGSNYIGKPGDYYNFSASGKLYIHQDTMSYSRTYKISADTVLTQYTYINGQTNQLDSAYNAGYLITNLTANTCTLFSKAISPETIYTNIINLKKE